jgi:hypothetical protein
MTPETNIRGFLEGKGVVPFRSGNVYNMFDGKRLDRLEIDNIIISSQDDCDELIKFLQLHKFCFLKNKK